LKEPFMKTTRRTFVIQSVLGAGALASMGAAQAAMVDEKDPQATALSYVADASKSPKAKPGQACEHCALFQGKAGDAAGACALFAGKQVAAKGWCSAFAKKA
jgi:hypothetical protein